MNEEIKNVDVAVDVAVENQVEAVEGAEKQEDSHVTFEIPKGKDGEMKFFFSIPKTASLGVAYDAAFEMLNHITKVIQDTTMKMQPKVAEKEEQKSSESDENN